MATLLMSERKIDQLTLADQNSLLCLLLLMLLVDLYLLHLTDQAE